MRSRRQKNEDDRGERERATNSREKRARREEGGGVKSVKYDSA